MTAGHSYSLHGPIALLRLFSYVFAHEFLFNPQFDLEPVYIIRKPILYRIQRYILRREIFSTFTHESIINQCAISALYSPQTAPSLRRSPPKSNTPIPSPTPLTTPNGIPIQSVVLPLHTLADGQMGYVKALSHEHSAHRATH